MGSSGDGGWRAICQATVQSALSSLNKMVSKACCATHGHECWVYRGLCRFVFDIRLHRHGESSWRRPDLKAETEFYSTERRGTEMFQPFNGKFAIGALRRLKENRPVNLLFISPENKNLTSSASNTGMNKRKDYEHCRGKKMNGTITWMTLLYTSFPISQTRHSLINCFICQWYY